MVKSCSSAAALAAASPSVDALRADADPAIFMVRDADTTVYIFGTFHALDGQAEWFNTRSSDAFEKSNELVLETLIPERPDRRSASATEPVRMPSRRPRRPRSWRPPAWRSTPASRRACRSTTAPTWSCATRRSGRQAGRGPRDARIAAQHVHPHAAGRRRCRARPATPVGDAADGSLSKAMAEMQSAWKRGDQSVFVRMLEQLESGSPDTYRMMFTERNARWADWIAARMQTPGTVFVAVGAGHLAGKDSLLVRLAEQGIPSQRVN